MSVVFLCFFFHSPPTTAISTLSLHDALPILMLSFLVAGLVCAFSALCYAELSAMMPVAGSAYRFSRVAFGEMPGWVVGDRKSTRLNSSHPSISYAVFCLKKKKMIITAERH